jgi:apolipoprotein D and lipocalin family protein
MHRCVSTLTLALACISPSMAADLPPPQTVASVDINRYLGTWYEIANFPRFFQRQCVGDTTADYTARKDGNVDVQNRCRKRDGSFDEAHGVAELVKGSNNAKLEVTFLPPFSGDYWIIGLDPDYRWSVVASPNRKSLWILSRTPQLPKTQLDLALKVLNEQGYPLDKLKYTQQGQ